MHERGIMSSFRNPPKVAERPHSEVMVVRLLLVRKRIKPLSLLGLIGPAIALASHWRRVMANIMRVDVFFVPTRTSSAAPAISAGGFRHQRRLYAGHVKVFLAAVTADRIRAANAAVGKDAPS